MFSTFVKLALLFDTSIHGLTEQIGYSQPDQYYTEDRFAYMSPHSLEGDLKYLVLNPLDYILDKNGYKNLEYPKRIEFIQDLSDLLLDKKSNLKKSSYKEIKSIIKEFFTVDNFFGPNEINEDTRNKIEDLFDSTYSHITDTFMFWSGEAFFNDYENTNTVKFLKRILLAGNLYGSIIMEKLSSLIMGYRTSITGQLNAMVDIDLRRPTLERILFNLNNWDLQTFNDLTGLELSNYEMVIRQKAMINEVKKWIYNNDYVAKNLIKSSKANIQSKSYDAYLNIMYASTLRAANERGLITFDEIKPISDNRFLEKKLGAYARTLHSLYSGKTYIGPEKYGGWVDYNNEKDPIKKAKAREKTSKNLEAIYSTIVEWHTEEFGTRVQNSPLIQTIKSPNGDSIITKKH